MKYVIFAGGTGRRLWPISRKKSPKQFEPIVGEKSTLQMMIDNLTTIGEPADIFISTNEGYADLIRQQLPQIPESNVIGEPTRRDLAPAVGLAMAHLVQNSGDLVADEAVAILWGDSIVANTDNLQSVLSAGAQLLQDESVGIIFVGESPRFANENLGWIGLGEELGTTNTLKYYGFDSLTYRPQLDVCQEMFAEKTHVWNTGYFITTPRFVRAMYQEFQPVLWSQLVTIESTIGGPEYVQVLNRVYPEMESTHFDSAILENLSWDRARVLFGDLGWSDPGTLYALKENLAASEDANVTMGEVIIDSTSDSLVYNYDDQKLLVAVGLDGHIVVNTEDAILVVHKDSVPLVKNIVDGLEGTEYESYS